MVPFIHRWSGAHQMPQSPPPILSEATAECRSASGRVHACCITEQCSICIPAAAGSGWSRRQLSHSWTWLSSLAGWYAGPLWNISLSHWFYEPENREGSVSTWALKSSCNFIKLILWKISGSLLSSSPINARGLIKCRMFKVKSQQPRVLQHAIQTSANTSPHLKCKQQQNNVRKSGKPRRRAEETQLTLGFN